MDLLDIQFTPSVEAFISHESLISPAPLGMELRTCRKRRRLDCINIDSEGASVHLTATVGSKKRSKLTVYLGSWENLSLQVPNCAYGSQRRVHKTRASLQVVRRQLRLAAYNGEEDECNGQWVAGIPDDWCSGLGGLLRKSLTASEIEVTNVTVEKPSHKIPQFLVSLDVFIQDSAFKFGQNVEPEVPLRVRKRAKVLNSLHELLLRGLQLINAPITVSSDTDEYYKAAGGYYEYEAHFETSDGILESLRPALDAPSVDVPANIRNVLLPFQMKTLRWMREQESPKSFEEKSCHPSWIPIETSDGFCFYSHESYQALSKERFVQSNLHPGGCLFSGSGLGKTLQIISLVALNSFEASAGLVDIQTLSSEPPIKSTLVVVPTCLAHHWLTECKKYSNLKTAFYSGDTSWTTLTNNSIRPYAAFIFSDYDIVVTTMDVVKRERILTTQTRASPLLQVRWWRLVLDDAHLLLTVKSAATISINCISRQNTWAVTADPAVNSAMDFHPYLAFVDQDDVIDSSNFKKYVVEPFEKQDGYARFRIMGLLRRVCWRQVLTHQIIEISLPPLIEEVITVSFSSIEQTIYDEMKAKVREDLKNIRRRAGLYNNIYSSNDFRRRFLALRQLCDHYQINDHSAYGRERMSVENIFQKFVHDKIAEIGEFGDRLVEKAVFLGCLCVVTQVKHADQTFEHYEVEHEALIELLQSAMTIADDTIRHVIESARTKLQEERYKTQNRRFAKVLEIENILTQIRQLLMTVESTMVSVADQEIRKRTIANKLKLQAQLNLNTSKKAQLLDWICDVKLPTFGIFTDARIYGLLTRKYYLDKLIDAAKRYKDINLDHMGRPSDEKAVSLMPEGTDYTLNLPCHSSWSDLRHAVLFARTRHYGSLLQIAQADRKRFSAEQGKLRFLRRQLAEHVKKMPKSRRPWLQESCTDAPRNVEESDAESYSNVTPDGISAEDNPYSNEAQEAEEALDDGDDHMATDGEEESSVVVLAQVALDSPTNAEQQAHEEEERHQQQEKRRQRQEEEERPQQRRQEEEEQEDMCLICQGPLTSIAMLPCAHQFCQECVDLYMDSQKGNYHQLCPQCREPFLRNDLIRLDDNEEAFEVKDAVQGSYGTKISALVYDLVCRLGKCQSAKAVIFSAWPTMLKYLRSAIAEENIGVVNFAGSENELFGPLTTFHKNPSLRVLLLPLRSKKEYVGLDLGCCNVVYFMEPNINLSLETDALRVVIRLGQSRPVQVVRLIMNGTIEENIIRLRTSDEDGSGDDKMAPDDSESVVFGDLCKMLKLSTLRYARRDVMSQRLDIGGGGCETSIKKHKRKAAVEWV